MKPTLLFRSAPALVLALSLPAQVAPELADRIIQEGLENSRVMEFQDHLCNHIGSRLTGSDAFTHACDWAQGEFEAMGLSSRLEEWDTWDIVWNRGQWSGRVVSPRWHRSGWAGESIPLELHVATPAWTAGTVGAVEGPMVRMPENAEELEALGKRMGEVYLFGARPRGRSEFGRALSDAVEKRPPLGYVQSAKSTRMTDPRYENQIRVFGSHTTARRSWDKLPTVPEIIVRDDQAELLEEMLDSGNEVVVRFDIRNRFRAGPIPLHNVVADIVGTEKPDEYVIVCGHLDSWHQATGATDNGTGTCSTMEAARILSAVGARPKRSIRFILWGGEEQGLLGSAKYTTMHRQDLDKVSAVLNHDTGTNWAQSLTVTDAMYEPFSKVLEPVMTKMSPPEDFDGPVFNLRKRAEIGGGGGGSDHASFLSKGVPAWSWGLEGRASYGYGWHSQWDTYDIVIPEYQRHTSTVIALTALGLANLPELLPREGIVRRSRGGGLAGLIENEFGLAVGEDLAVTKVVEKSVAARAGVAKGDVLTALWEKELESQVDIYRAWREYRDEDEVVFKLKRGNTLMTLKGSHAPEPATPSADTKPAGDGKPEPAGAKGGGKSASDQDGAKERAGFAPMPR